MKDLSNGPIDSVVDFLSLYGSTITAGLEPAKDAGNLLGEVDSNKVNFDLRGGYVKYVVPHMGSAFVQLEGGGTIICSIGTNGSPDIGASDVSPIGDNVNVVVSVDSDTQTGAILSVSPAVVIDESQAFCDSVVTGSTVGYYASPQYSDFLQAQLGGGGTLAFSGDMPIDGLPGDKTVMSTQGVGWHVDDEMAFMRTSEVCGLFLFRADGHTRLAGESVAIETTGQQYEGGLSVYECYNEAANSVYPWEAMGFATFQDPQADWLNYLGPEAVLGGGKAPLEPQDQYLDMIPISRVDEFGGYLGQGEMTIISSPQPEDAGYTEINTLENPIDRAGLLREQKLMDGTYLLETSRQLFMAKTADVPVVRRTAARDVLTDDQSYKYSGVADAGSEPLPHKVSQLATENPEDALFAVEDAYSYASGWQGLNAAVYNPNVEIDYREQTTNVDLQLDQSDFIDLPDPEKVKIDDRYDEVDIYRILSLFTILPDGSIVIRNGMGSEIRLTQGGVEISGTTVQVSSAKTTSIIGGGVSIKGQKYAEFISSRGDVRMKAEEDMLLLSGNSGRGGTLLENRAVSTNTDWNETPDDSYSSGISLKSPNSHVSLLGQFVQLRTGVGDVKPGNIYVDAGERTLMTRGSSHLRYSDSNGVCADFYASNPNNIRKANFYFSSFSVINTDLAITGNFLASKAIQAGGNILTANGHFGSTQTKRFRGLVGDVSPFKTEIQDNLGIAAREVDKVGDYGEAIFKNYSETMLAQDKPGNPDVVSNTAFGFPTSTGYGASQTVLRQPFWQKALENYTSAYNEPIVSYREEQTRPWPGNETWEREDSMIVSTSENSYFDAASQMPIDGNIEENRQRYEEAALPSVKRVSLAEGFKSLTNY